MAFDRHCGFCDHPGLRTRPHFPDLQVHLPDTTPHLCKVLVVTFARHYSTLGTGGLQEKTKMEQMVPASNQDTPPVVLCLEFQVFFQIKRVPFEGSPFHLET